MAELGEEEAKGKIQLFFTEKLEQDREFEPSRVNEFEVVKELGSGAFSTVFLAKRWVFRDFGR